MQKVYSDVIQFKGSHEAFGRMQGELLQDSALLDNWTSRFHKRSEHHFIIDMPHFEKVMQAFAPAILEELSGLSDSLSFSLEDTIRYFGGYYLEFGKSGCSIVTGRNYMVRNYDNDPFSYDGRFVLYQPTDVGYATIGPSMQVTGRTDGMNEMGLTMGYNFINRKQSNDGFVCNMIGRIILENCANIEEAVALLKEIPHRHSFSYVLTDPTERTVIVEASPRKVVTREGNTCTNHFERLTEENRYRMDDSIRRQAIMQEASKENLAAIDAYRMMNELAYGVYSTNYGAWAGTIHTALYNPKQLQAGMSFSYNRLPYIFNFKKWLAGERLHVKKLNGLLDSSHAFGNVNPSRPPHM